MSHDPAKLNRIMSAEIQSQAEEKLGRSLTSDEEYRIWNLGSFMGLEAVNNAIIAARSGEEVAECLAGLPKSEPLPNEYTRRS